MIISGKCENDLYQMCYQSPFQLIALPDDNAIEIAGCFIGKSHQSDAKQRIVHQGDVMGAPSRIHVELIDDHQVQVKGEVVEVRPCKREEKM